MNAKDTFARGYFEVQKVLDEELGTEEEDGAGERIVADVLLALDKRERRGAAKALRTFAEMYNDERVAELTVRGNVAMAALDRAHLIESGEVTP